MIALLADGRRGDAVEYFMTALMGVPAGQVAGMRQAAFWRGREGLALAEFFGS